MALLVLAVSGLINFQKKILSEVTGLGPAADGWTCVCNSFSMILEAPGHCRYR
jgi:hypothetical protein